MTNPPLLVIPSRLVLCKIDGSNEPFTPETLAVGLSGSTIPTKGVEGVIIVGNLLAIGITVHL